MRQIRRGTFETNSSSTHSITFCSLDSWEKWINGTTLFDDNTRKFLEFSELTADDYIEAEKSYNNNKRKYYKDWSELTDSEREEYIYKYVASLRKQEKSLSFEENGLTYQEFMQDCSSDGLQTETSYYTSPSGDKLVITCAYGYN